MRDVVPGERLSVIIATFNRANLLQDCLARLAVQRFEPGDEVVVVDNGSTDRTPEVIAAAARRFPVPLVGLRELRPGKSHAIGTGVAHSRGTILALIDDDVRVADDWAVAARLAMSDPEVGLAGGRVEPLWEGATPFWLRVRSESGGYGPLAAPIALLDYGNARIDLGERTAIGANLIVRRSVYERVGGYPSDVGKLRGTLMTGEDHELCRLVQAAGFRAVYDPRPVVGHHVPAARLRLSYYLRWFYWSGITNAVLEADSRGAASAMQTFLGIPRYLVRRIPVGLGQMLVRMVTGRPAAGIEAAMGAAFDFGYVAQRWGLTRVRSRSKAAATMETA